MAIQTERLQKMFVSDSSIMMETLRRIARAAEAATLSEDQIDRAFRAAHSLKSEAGFLRLESITTTAHSLEDVLARIRDQHGEISSDELSQLTSGIAVLEAKLDDYYRDHDRLSAAASGDHAAARSPAARVPVENQEVIRSAAPATLSRERAPSLEAAGRSPAVQSMLREARQRGERLYRLRLRLETVAELAYARAFLVVNNLELGCSVVSMQPPLDELGHGASELDLLLTSSDNEQALRKRVHVDEVAIAELVEVGYDELAVHAPLEPEDAAGTPSSAPAADAFHEEFALLSEILTTEAAALEGSAPIPEDQRQRAHTRINRIARYLRHRSSGPAPVQLLDRLQTVRGEMERYAHEQSQRVKVIVGGNGALVPPAVSDVVTEMTLHLVRNSIDHAFSRPGSTDGATVSISVDRLKGAMVRLIVADNGSGVDEAAVRSPGDDQDATLFDLLATPGFTTRGEATIGSGRGVGLDAVRHSALRLLGGSVDLDNRVGKGFAVRVKFPVDSRLLSVDLVQYARVLYAIPSAVVARSEELRAQRLKRDSFGEVFYEYEGAHVAVISPSGRPPRVDKLQSQAEALICRGPDGLIVVAVDSRMGTEAVVRDTAGRRTVYSRTIGGEAQLVVPGIL